MSVLNTIKGKIVNVQQDISDSFRSLTKANHRSKSVDVDLPSVDCGASSELLSRYQKLWAEMHKTSDDLAQRAQSVDRLITNLLQYMDQQNMALNQFTAEMSSLVQLVSDVNMAKDKIVSLDGAFGELESLLIDLEDICDQRSLLKMKQEHENELKKYRQSKNRQLEQVKVGLAKVHADKVQRFEAQHNIQLQERQKVFEEAFQEQIAKYKTTGQVDYGPSSPIRSVDLAEIEIEQDRNELDEFLSSVEENISIGGKTVEDVGNDSEDDVEMEKVCVLTDEDCNPCSNNDPANSQSSPDVSTCQSSPNRDAEADLVTGSDRC